MEIISFAYAQGIPAPEGSPGFWSANAPLVFACVGTIIIAVAMTLVVKCIPVSGGHSMFLGAGLALLVFPFIATLEWSDDGFKLNLKSAAEGLNTEIGRLTKENSEIREELLKINSALKAATEKISQVSLSNPQLPTLSGVPDQSKQSPQWRELLQPDFFTDFEVRNRSAIESNKESLETIDSIKKQLQQVPNS